jgi:hypothetical protein
MIEAVFVFGGLNVLFEFILLCLLAPRTRLRVLGSPPLCAALHVIVLGVNLFVHWGTLIGSMASILSFCASLMTVAIARLLFGTVQSNRHYRVGWLKYRPEELA